MLAVAHRLGLYKRAQPVGSVEEQDVCDAAHLEFSSLWAAFNPMPLEDGRRVERLVHDPSSSTGRIHGGSGTGRSASSTLVASIRSGDVVVFVGCVATGDYIVTRARGNTMACCVHIDIETGRVTCQCWQWHKRFLCVHICTVLRELTLARSSFPSRYFESDHPDAFADEVCTSLPCCLSSVPRPWSSLRCCLISCSCPSSAP
jgi:hypothetical protein